MAGRGAAMNWTIAVVLSHAEYFFISLLNKVIGKTFIYF